MPHPESELEMCRRHVREGAKRIARQREIVARFTRKGYDATEAEHLLSVFREIQQHSEEHLARVSR